MWKVLKPNLSDALSDVDLLENLGIVPTSEVGKIKRLVKQYDSQDGQVTDAQHSLINRPVAARIHKAYEVDKLYNQKKPFHPVRLELYEKVSRCPYCSTGTGDDTLDHYMSKSDYHAMSMCRLNLVPCCWKCNGTKNTKPYSDFVHPYYGNFPEGVEFFCADISLIGGIVIFQFRVVGTHLSSNLYSKLTTQINHLRLNERLRKSGIEFLRNAVIGQLNNIEAIHASIPLMYKKTVENYGLNDWRTALVRGMMNVLNSSNPQPLIDAILGTAIEQRDLGT